MSKAHVFPENFKAVTLRKLAQEELELPGVVGSTQEGQVAELFIIGAIGGWWGVYGVDVYNALAGKDVRLINVYLSSGGGGIFEGFQIHDLLAGHSAPVHMHIFSIAASSATAIAALPRENNNRVIMSRQAVHMIHEGAAGMYGYYQAGELEHEAMVLRKLNNRFVDLYQRRTGLEEERVREFMAMETWLEPEEALELGFIDEVRDHIAVPFERADLSFDLWQQYFAEHTAQHAIAQLKPRGYTRLAANALTKLKAKRPAAFSDNSNPNLFMDFGAKLMAFLAGKGWKIANENGEAVSNETVASQLNEATKQEGPMADLLGEEMRNQIVALVTDTMAGKGGAGEANETVDAIAALRDQFVALNDQVQELAAGGNQEQQEQRQEQQEQQESRMAKLAAEIKGIKLAKAGGQRASDQSGQRIGADTDQEQQVATAFGPGTALFRSLSANQLVDASQIKAIEAAVRKKRQAQA